MAKRLKYLALFTLSLLLCMPSTSDANVIIADSVQVTDVTPVQFSVVWGTVEPATGTVKVFADADGTVPVTEASVTSESPNFPPAEDIGVMKVRVVNLKPNTQYYYQTQSTSKNNSITTSYPESPPFNAVTTERASNVVNNDVFAQQISVGNGKSTMGTLVMATVEQASHPITGWAGDGVPDGWIAIDMNNFYDKNTNSNLELNGGEPITLTLFGGSLGTVETNDTVPAETGGIQAGSVVVNLPDSGDDPPASPSPTPTSAGGGGGSGGSCFIATAAFGSPLDPHVGILQTYKNRYLTEHSMGRRLMEYYYRYSPKIAEYINKHQNMNLIIRYSLLPVVFLTYLYMTHGVIFLCSLAIIILACICARSFHIVSRYRH